MFEKSGLGDLAHEFGDLDWQSAEAQTNALYETLEKELAGEDYPGTVTCDVPTHAVHEHCQTPSSNLSAKISWTQSTFAYSYLPVPYRWNVFADDSTGRIASYEWDWGDGSPIEKYTTNPVPVRHAFEHIGTFTVTLTVRDANGNVATDTVELPQLRCYYGDCSHATQPHVH